MEKPIDDPPTDSKPEPPRKPPSLLFRLLIPVTFLFVFTCFIVLTHDLFGAQDSAFARWLTQYGTRLLGIEAAAAVVLAVVAMTADRLRTLSSRQEPPHASDSSGSTQNADS